MENRTISWDKIALKQSANAIEYIAKDSFQNAEKIPSNPQEFPPDKYKLNNNGLFQPFEF